MSRKKHRLNKINKSRKLIEAAMSNARRICRKIDWQPDNTAVHHLHPNSILKVVENDNSKSIVKLSIYKDADITRIGEIVEVPRIELFTLRVFNDELSNMLMPSTDLVTKPSLPAEIDPVDFQSRVDQTGSRVQQNYFGEVPDFMRAAPKSEV